MNVPLLVFGYLIGVYLKKCPYRWKLCFFILCTALPFARLTGPNSSQPPARPCKDPAGLPYRPRSSLCGRPMDIASKSVPSGGINICRILSQRFLLFAKLPKLYHRKPRAEEIAWPKAATRPSVSLYKSAPSIYVQAVITS